MKRILIILAWVLLIAVFLPLILPVVTLFVTPEMGWNAPPHLIFAALLAVIGVAFPLLSVVSFVILWLYALTVEAFDREH